MIGDLTGGCVFGVTVYTITVEVSFTILLPVIYVLHSTGAIVVWGLVLGSCSLSICCWLYSSTRYSLVLLGCCCCCGVHLADVRSVPFTSVKRR